MALRRHCGILDRGRGERFFKRLDREGGLAGYCSVIKERD